MAMIDETMVLIKGAGDLATGVGWRLRRCGFPVAMIELPLPLTVRRRVAFAQAVFDGEQTIAGVTARRVAVEDVPGVLLAGEIPLIVDPRGESVAELVPSLLVDAVMAKTNTGTRLADAPLVVALGPGFSAGVDCHAVVETNRGHNLGRVLWLGSAEADTGVPGSVAGVGQRATRVVRAPVAGRLHPRAEIGDTVAAEAILAVVETAHGEEIPVPAPFPGVLRGLIHHSVPLTAGLKIGDLDPRCRPEHAFTISDKSLAVGGGVLEAILSWHHRDQREDELHEQ